MDEGPLQQILNRHGQFGHREHLELAWTCLEGHPSHEARRLVADSLRHLAASHGMPDRYHETITQTWVKLVALHRDACRARSFDEFIERNPELLDGSLLTRHYSKAALGSDAARANWIAPDVRALPKQAA